MNLTELTGLFAKCRLVASVQAAEHAPTDDPESLARLAQASQREGVTVLRSEGIDKIRAARARTGLPTIGLIKRPYPDSDVYITATMREVDELLSTDTPVIALDGTNRPRPGSVSLKDLIQRVHEGGRLALADIDSVESAQFAVGSGADLVGSTLSGYTNGAQPAGGPDLELVRALIGAVGVPVIAEGRYQEPWHVEAAVRIGAVAVVVGGALNDPEKTTRRLLPHPEVGGNIGAVDIGGTWLRFGLFSPNWEMLDSDRTPNPRNHNLLLAWIRDKIAHSGVVRVGVGTGGIVDPRTGEVWRAKEYLMPDHVGIVFSEATLGVPTWAHGDGNAQAWGHACVPQFAGRRVATLAIGTGVGAGFVVENKLWTGPRGEYPRINDLPSALGGTTEDLLGGIHLTKDPTENQKTHAIKAFEGALQAIHDLYFPDDIVISGSVGLSPWLQPHVARLGAFPSPFDHDAGMFGAAALALFPIRS